MKLINPGGGGGSGGFTPAYGGSYDTTLGETTTTVSAIDTDVNIAFGTAATIDGTTGLEVVAGGGVKNISGEAGDFRCDVSFGTNATGASKWRRLGVRVQRVDTTYEAMQQTIIGFTYTAYPNISHPSWTSYVRLEPNEIAWACQSQITATAENMQQVGISLNLMRIA